MAKYVELGQSDNRDVDLLDVKLVKLLPETEQLVVEPTTKEQNFKPSVEKYFDDVKVGAIKTESATVKSKETAEKIYPTQDHYFDSIDVKALALEEVQVEPTTTPQNIGVGEGYDAIKSVKVNAVNPSDYYKPEESISIEPKTNAQTFNAPSGKVYNSISVAAVTSAIDPNILSTNIRKGKTILGVVGNMEADKPDQEKVAYASTTGDVVVVADAGYELTKVTIPKVNVSEYVKEEVSLDVIPSETSQTLTPSGKQVYNKVNVGAIPSDYVGSSVTRISEQTYIPTIDDIEIQANQFLSGKQTIKGDVNLVAENIAEGKEIFGILGTHQGGSVKFAELVQGNISEVTAQDLVDVTTIRDDAFANLEITSVEIPSNVTIIGDSAFANNEISSLTLNEGIETIGASAFANNPITTLAIPASVTTIGASAFAGTQMTELNMGNQPNPPSVTNTTFPSTLEKIYVAYGDYDTYLSEWSDYSDKIVRLPAIPSTITVIVNDYTGALVSGASVTISGNGQTYTGTTDSVGTFVQGDLQPATYTISVADMEGFKTPDVSEVVVEEDTQNSVTVTYLEKPSTPAFSKATTAEISAISAEISANNMSSADVESIYGWKIGDTTTIPLSTGENIEMRIIGFNHDDKSDGSGKAGITLEMTHCLNTKYRIVKYSSELNWEQTEMYVNILPNIKTTLPKEWRDAIITVDKKYLKKQYDSFGVSPISTCKSDLFLISRTELTGEADDASTVRDEGSQYEYWTLHNTDVGRIKYYDSNSDGAPDTACIWGTRSQTNFGTSYYFTISSSGATSATTQWTSAVGRISIAFCV